MRYVARMTTARSGERIPQWTAGDRLRKAREFAGLDQIALAELIDVSRTTISNYEADKVGQRRIVVKQWALACGVDLAWLEGGKPPHTPALPVDENEECAARDSNPEPAGSELRLLIAA